MSTIELHENGRFLFEDRSGDRDAGEVIELTDTSARIRWEDSGKEKWYALDDFRRPTPASVQRLTIVEKLKPRS